MSSVSAARRPTAALAGRAQTAIVMVVTAVVIGALAFVAGGGLDDGVTGIELTGAVSAKAPAVGETPPGFSATTYDGKPISLAEYAGRPVWLTFGASWCADCRAEAADLQATYAKYQAQGLAVVGVFISESAADIGAYAGRAGLTFPIAVDPDTQVAGAYRTLGIPTHFFIGRDGRIREIRIGALGADDMDRAVAAIVR